MLLPGRWTQPGSWARTSFSERQSSICHTHQRKMRHWSIDAVNVPIHLLEKRRDPHQTRSKSDEISSSTTPCEIELEDPGLNDHDRPLNKRGRQTAKMMAAYLRRAKIAPDLVVCSTAMRAQQTLDPIIKAAKKPPTIILVRGIHEGTQRALWEQLWNLPESAKSVLLIGHNPALQDLALELAHTDSNKLTAENFRRVRWRVSASMEHGRRWSRMVLSSPHL